MAIYRNRSFERKYQATSGGTASGALSQYGGKTWISQNLKTVPEGEMASEISDAVVEIEKTSSATTYADGDVVQFNFTTQKSVASGGTVIGSARKASTSSDATVLVALNDYMSEVGSGIVKSVRQRFTIAEVNAGATLLPARAGVRYRMVNGAMIAVGGAAAAHTTIDILGTSSTARKLVAFAVAQTAQSAFLQPGVTGAAVLADGASYTANDANTAITVGRAGSPITTATHIDVLFSYVEEPA